MPLNQDVFSATPHPKARHKKEAFLDSEFKASFSLCDNEDNNQAECHA